MGGPIVTSLWTSAFEKTFNAKKRKTQIENTTNRLMPSNPYV